MLIGTQPTFGQNGLKIYAANCTGLPQGDTYDGAAKAPVARDGFAIDPPPECLSGQCDPGPARGGSNIPTECL